jgi:hypothetical protein
MEGEMSGRTEDRSATVPQAQQAGIAERLIACAKSYVWTVRMLTTLITRVERGPWFRLYDKIFSERNFAGDLRAGVSEEGSWCVSPDGHRHSSPMYGRAG